MSKLTLFFFIVFVLWGVLTDSPGTAGQYVGGGLNERLVLWAGVAGILAALWALVQLAVEGMKSRQHYKRIDKLPIIHIYENGQKLATRVVPVAFPLIGTRIRVVGADYRIASIIACGRNTFNVQVVAA